MNSKRNEWKGWELFIVAAIAAVLTSTLSQTTKVEAQEIAEPSIENRLAKVRERLKQIRDKSDISSLKNSLETEKDKMIQAQWPNYWNDWSNWNKRPWSDWNDRPWSDWNDRPWSDWNDRPWSDYY